MYSTCKIMYMNYEDIYTYKVAIHIHSLFSDGTGDINLISKAAKKAGLDCIIITDHNYYDTEEGIINGVYVIKGEEISPPKCNHYLAFGINKTINYNEDPQKYINEVRTQGGFGFAAHPDEGTWLDEKGEISVRRNSHHCIPWTDKSITPDGIEIWNWFSNWADNLNDRTIFNLGYSYFFKHNIVKSPSKLTINWWDDLNNESGNVIPAIGGVDAHALKFYKYIIPVNVFPYETCFNTITNIIYLKKKLSENFEEAKKQILNALKNGNNMIINRHVNKNIPLIYVTNSKNKFFCGETVTLDNDCYLHYESIKDMEVCLIYNGEEEKRFTSDKFIQPLTKSGKYRIEVLFKGNGYLYTNPFNIKDKQEINE